MIRAHLLFVLVMMVGTLSSSNAHAQSNANPANAGSSLQVATLKDQLEKGLRARRKIEFTFVGHVVQLVDQGKLPLELVKGTFSWVVKNKAQDNNYLVPFFEKTLRERARRANIKVLDQVPTTFVTN